MSRPQPLPRGRAVRGAAALAAGLAVAVPLAGCSLGGRSERKAAQEARNGAAAALEQRLADPAAARAQYEWALHYNDQMDPPDPERLRPERVEEIRQTIERLKTGAPPAGPS